MTAVLRTEGTETHLTYSLFSSLDMFTKLFFSVDLVQEKSYAYGLCTCSMSPTTYETLFFLDLLRSTRVN